MSELKQSLAEIVSIERRLLDSRKNANEIGGLMNILKTSDSLAVILRCTQALKSVFADFKQSDQDSEFGSWTCKQWSRYSAICLKLLKNETIDPRISVVGLKCLMEISKSSSEPLDSFHDIVCSIISIERHVNGTGMPKELLNEFLTEYIGSYDDIFLYTVESLYKFISTGEFKQLENQQVIVRNITDILLRYSFNVSESPTLFYVNQSLEWDSFTKMCKKDLTKCWTLLLSPATVKMTLEMYRTILLHIEDRIFPNISSPLLLSDFLTDSYNLAVKECDNGSVIVPLLALRGLFVLMAKHNFDYPDFFPNLYRILRPNLFTSKHRESLLPLIALFLKSSHLPAYLVSAFIKRLARMSLSLPVDGTLFCLTLIFNLLRRNTPCRILIDRVECDSQDVFLENEQDPSKCHASDSSLWELKALTCHYSSEVSRKAELLLGIKFWEKQRQDWVLQTKDNDGDLYFKRIISKKTRNSAVRHEFSPISKKSRV